jgi:hypothetical protein
MFLPRIETLPARYRRRFKIEQDRTLPARYRRRF